MCTTDCYSWQNNVKQPDEAAELNNSLKHIVLRLKKYRSHITVAQKKKSYYKTQT